MFTMPWSRRQPIKWTADIVANPKIKIETLREKEPRWRRRYVIDLNDRAMLTIDARNLVGSRYVSGELRQPNGKYVTFQPDEIADKIIDPTLVPLVQRACDEILAIDRAYMSSDRYEFVDESGARWVRAA